MIRSTRKLKPSPPRGTHHLRNRHALGYGWAGPSTASHGDTMISNIHPRALPPSWGRGGGAWRICQGNLPRSRTICVQLRLVGGRRRRDKSAVSTTVDHSGRFGLQERLAPQGSHPWKLLEHEPPHHQEYTRNRREDQRGRRRHQAKTILSNLSRNRPGQRSPHCCGGPEEQ
jgi:hypothetical protein